MARSAGNGYAEGVEVRAQRQFFGWAGIFLYRCFLPAIKELTDGLRATQVSNPENIKIARKEILSFDFFAPFNSFFFEAQNSLNLKQNQGVIKKLCLKSILKLSADQWFTLYKLAKPFFFTAFQDELAAM